MQCAMLGKSSERHHERKERGRTASTAAADPQAVEPMTARLVGEGHGTSPKPTIQNPTTEKRNVLARGEYQEPEG